MTTSTAELLVYAQEVSLHNVFFLVKSGQKLAQYQLSASTVGVSCVNVATGIEVLIVLTFQLTGHGRMTSVKTVTDSGQDSHGGTHTNYDTHNPYTLPQPERFLPLIMDTIIAPGSTI